MISRLTILIALIAIWPIRAMALDPDTSPEKYIHHAWTTQEGLPQNTVHAIALDHQGYIWLGTDRGAARFDGYGFKEYHKDNTPEITHNRVTSLLLAQDGKLWLGTDGGGVVTFKDGQFQRPGKDTLLARLSVNAIAQDQDRHIYLGTTGNGLMRLDNGSFEPASNAYPSLPRLIRCLIVDRRDRVWCGTPNGLYCIAGKKKWQFHRTDGLVAGHITALFEDSHGFLWIGTHEGLNRVRNRIELWKTRQLEIDTFNVDRGLAGNYIHRVQEDSDGNIWIAATGGLSRFTQPRVGDKPGIVTIGSLAAHTILSLMEDNGGNLWIGTTAKGLNVLRNGSFQHLTQEDGLSVDDVKTIFQDRSGVLWIGTEGGGLNRKENDTITTYTRDHGLSSNYIESINQDRDGVLWIGTPHGLNRFKNDTFRSFTTQDGLSNNMIKCLYPDRRGNLWIGTYGGGLNRYHDGTFQVLDTQDGLPDNFVLALAEDLYNNIWIGTKRGICSFDRQLVRDFSNTPGVPKGMVTDIYCDPNGSVWIATDNEGLYKYSNGAFQRFDRGWGFAGTPIYRVLEDDRHSLWLSTGRGVFAIPRRRFQPDGWQYGWRHFQEDDGMQTDVCTGGSQPAGWKTTDGKIWFPTNRGAAVMDLSRNVAGIGPKPILPNTAIPEELQTGFSYVTVIHEQPVIIDQIVVDKKPIPLESQFILPSGADSIEFRFVALNYRTPGKTLYRYRLSGYDPSWQLSRENVARYNHLPSGEYEFKVFARNSDGNWSYEGDSYLFTVDVPFYDSFWFYFAVTLLLVLAILSIPRLRALNDDTEPIEIKYKRSSLTPNKSHQHLKQLQEIMDTEKLYLDPAMSLTTLAKRIGISKEDLSQVINEQLEVNFKNFLNQYRIEAAKEKLTDPKENQFVLLKIAFDVGFNSKSAFNASFKKATGMTPSQFRKQHQEDN